MAPPSQSFRSSTVTRQPARASKAAHASELTPLPMMTASVSAIDERPELVVGHKPALSCTKLLDLYEQLRAAILTDVKAELLRLDPNRVEATLLAEDDRAIGRDEARRVRLDRGRIVELRGDRARLAAEERLARDGLPWLERIAGEFAHLLRDIADSVELEVRLDAVEGAQRERDLAEV